MIRSTQRRMRRRSPGRLDPWSRSPDTGRIRPARVLAAQARMASGHYERAEVRDFLVDALLEELRRH